MSNVPGANQQTAWQPPAAAESQPSSDTGGGDQADEPEPLPRFVVIAPHSEHQTRSQAAAATQIVEFVIQTNLPGVEVVQLTTAGPTVLDLVNGKAFVGKEALDLMDAVYAQHYGTPPLPHWKAPEQHDDEDEAPPTTHQQPGEVEKVDDDDEDNDAAPAYTQFTLYVNANHPTSMNFASLVAENNFNINIGILSRTQPTSADVAQVERRNIRTATWIRYPTPNPKIKVVPCVENRATGDVYEGQKAVNDFMLWFEQSQHQQPPTNKQNQRQPTPAAAHRHQQHQPPTTTKHRPIQQPSQTQPLETRPGRVDSDGKPQPIVPKVIGNSHAKVTNEELLRMQERRKALLERRQPPAGRSQPKPVPIRHS